MRSDLLVKEPFAAKNETTQPAVKSRHALESKADERKVSDASYQNFFWNIEIGICFIMSSSLFLTKMLWNVQTSFTWLPRCLASNVY